MRLGYLWCQKLSAKEGRGNRRKVEEREEEKRNNGKRGERKGEEEAGKRKRKRRPKLPQRHRYATQELRKELSIVKAEATGTRK